MGDNELIKKLKDRTIYYNGKINYNNEDLKTLFQTAIKKVNDNDNDNKFINKCIVDIIASDLYELYSKNQLKKKGKLRQYKWNYIVNDIYKANKIDIDKLITKTNKNDTTNTNTNTNAEKVKQKLFNKLYNFLKNRSDFLKNRSLGKNEEDSFIKKDNKIGNLALDIRKYIKDDLTNITHSLESTLPEIIKSRIEHGIDIDEIRNEQKRNLYKAKFGTFKRDVLYNNPYIGNLFSAYINNLKNVPSDNRILYKNKLLYNEQYIRTTFDQYHKKLRVNRKKKYQESKEEKLKEKLLKARIERAVRNYIIKKKIDKIKNNANIKKQENVDKQKKLKEQDDSYENEAKTIITQLMGKDVKDITIQDSKITDLNRIINNLINGPKSYISKLSHGQLRDVILAENGGGSTKPHSTVQSGGAEPALDKVEKLEKIITILKQLNSNNYVDYNLDSIIKGLQDLLGGVDDVDTSIPELIKSTTIMKHHMYPEPLPVCDEDGTTCKENKEKLKKRLEYFKKLKELQTMHKDKKILTLNDTNVIKNIKTLESYFKPMANPNESVDVNNKEQLKTQEENQKKKYTELGTFTPIDQEKIKGNETYKKYNDIIKHLNKKKDFINPQISSKYMTTNTTVTTDKSFFHNLLNMEHFLHLFNNYKGSDFHIAAYSTPNKDPDPTHVYEEKRDKINSTGILQSEIPAT